MATPEREPPQHDTVMDVTEEQIARVYAQAFLGAIAEHPHPRDLVEQLGALVSEVLDKFPQLEQTLRSALVSQEQKERVLDRVFGSRVATEVLHFLKVLSRHDRLALLRTVSRLVAKLHAERSGEVEVGIRAAAALDERLQDEIRDQLRKTLQREPRLDVTVDPSLIAGMVIRVGDRVYDGSVATQLNQARKAMIARAVEAIETQPEKFLQTAG